MNSHFNLVNIIFCPEYLLTFAIILWLCWLWKRRHFYKFCFSFPTWWGFPIVGSLPHLKHLNYIFPKIEGIFHTKKSDNVVIWVGLYPILFTRDVHFIDFILTKREFLDKAHEIYHSVLDVFRGGLVANSAKDWLPIRPLLEPCFSRETVLRLFPIFNKHKSCSIAKLDALSNGEGHKLMKVVHDGILQLTMQTTMGKSAVKDKKMCTEFITSFFGILERCILKLFTGFMNLDWMLSFYKTKDIKKCHNHIDNLLKNFITEKENGKVDESSSSNIFISHIIKLYENNQLSWQDVIAESTTLFFASYETTAFSVFTSLVMMAMHPDIQEKLYEELKSSFPDPSCDISYENLSQMSYLDIVLKEVLRIVPPASFIARHIRQDTQYKDWPALIPKDMQVIICIFHLHRRTDIWGPDADEFRPSRFLDKNLTEEQRKAFIPFSKGYRMCLGYRYAQLVLKVLVVGIILNFQFETDFKYQDLQFSSHITTKYLKEPFLKIKRRKI